jgi:hypothetical protein
MIRYQYKSYKEEKENRERQVDFIRRMSECGDQMDELRSLRVAAAVSSSTSVDRNKRKMPTRGCVQPSRAAVSAAAVSSSSKPAAVATSSANCLFCNKEVSEIQDTFACANFDKTGFKCATCGEGVYCGECCFDQEGDFCAGGRCSKFFCGSCCPRFIELEEGADHYCEPACCEYPFIRKELEARIQQDGGDRQRLYCGW